MVFIIEGSNLFRASFKNKFIKLKSRVCKEHPASA